MTKKNYTHITAVVDRSGSMVTIQEDAQGGINQLIVANKEAPGQCTFALYQFDTEFETVVAPSNISMVGEYTLVPRGGTALLDAQWKAIQLTGEYLKSLPEKQRPEKVIFITVTDGGENMSKEIVGWQGTQNLKNKIEEQKNKYSWDFVYIGANQDAFAVGQSMGINTTTTYIPNTWSTKAMYGNLATATVTSRATGESMTNYLASSVTADGTLVFDKKDKEEKKEATTGDNK